MSKEHVCECGRKIEGKDSGTSVAYTLMCDWCQFRRDEAYNDGMKDLIAKCKAASPVIIIPDELVKWATPFKPAKVKKSPGHITPFLVKGQKPRRWHDE